MISSHQFVRRASELSVPGRLVRRRRDHHVGDAPDIGPGEVGGHDADDGEGLVIERHRRAHCRIGAAEALLPEPVADHGHGGVGSGPVVGRPEQAPRTALTPS